MSAISAPTTAAPTSHALFVFPSGRGDGFEASINGHMLELADPTDGRLAPSPDDLLVASIAADLAWTARTFLRAGELPDDVSVSASWRATEGRPSLHDVTLTVTVSRRAQAVRQALTSVFANRLVARSLGGAAVHVSLEGADR